MDDHKGRHCERTMRRHCGWTMGKDIVSGLWRQTLSIGHTLDSGFGLNNLVNTILWVAPGGWSEQKMHITEAHRAWRGQVEAHWGEKNLILAGAKCRSPQHGRPCWVPIMFILQDSWSPKPVTWEPVCPCVCYPRVSLVDRICIGRVAFPQMVLRCQTNPKSVASSWCGGTGQPDFPCPASHRALLTSLEHQQEQRDTPATQHAAPKACKKYTMRQAEARSWRVSCLPCPSYLS